MDKVKKLKPGDVQPLGKGLGRTIEEMRVKKKMDREALAERAGVTSKAVKHWETGQRIIGNECLPRVAHALETTPSKMYARTERRTAADGR